MIRISTVALAGLAVAVCADAAYAWGPATHIELADSILNHLALVPAVVAGVLSRNRVAFLYGNIAADIVFAKRWSRVKQFCHHWTTAFAVLKDARDEPESAYAYGYLSHLAADTVAHGKYVPRQITLSDCSVNFGHFYWEVRADARQPEWVWTLLEQTLQGDHSRFHALLELHITDTFLSYDLNRMVFERMNAFASRKGFRRTVGLWGRYSRWELPHDVMSGYRVECMDRIASVLSAGERSPVLRDDPNGTSALMELRVRRRDMSRLRRDGIAVKERILEAAAGLLPNRKVLLRAPPQPEEAGGAPGPAQRAKPT